MSGHSDYCRDCGRYAYYAKDIYGSSLAFCGAYLDTIAKDAKTAKHCRMRREKYDKPKKGGFRYE